MGLFSNNPYKVDVEIINEARYDTYKEDALNGATFVVSIKRSPSLFRKILEGVRLASPQDVAPPVSLDQIHQTLQAAAKEVGHKYNPDINVSKFGLNGVPGAGWGLNCPDHYKRTGEAKHSVYGFFPEGKTPRGEPGYISSYSQDAETMADKRKSDLANDARNRIVGLLAQNQARISTPRNGRA
jgi:hypothetical protein